MRRIAVFGLMLSASLVPIGSLQAQSISITPPGTASTLPPTYRRPPESIVWLNNDYIVVYDRAASLHAGLFKRFNLSLVTNPSISGNVVTETLASGQQLFIQTLLPLNRSTSATYDANKMNPISQLEPTQYILTVQDPANPIDTRVLHVLQGADAGAAMVPAAYLQSTSGTAFDGAVFGSAAVYFPVSTSVPFTGTSLSAPFGVHTVLVTGLAANANFSYSTRPAGSGTLITITPGGPA